MVELKDATLTVDGRTVFSNLSFVAPEGQLTCISGGTTKDRTLLARALMGFVPLSSGFITVDGELLTPYSVKTFRRLMAYWPNEASLQRQPVSFQPSLEGLEEVWSPAIALTPEEPTMPKESAPQAVTTVTEGKQIVVADNPAPLLLSELSRLASEGRVVIVISNDEHFAAAGKNVNIEY